MDARQILEAVWAWAQANPNISLPIAVILASAILRRFRWSPEHLWAITRHAYRAGAHGQGFHAFLASLLVPIIFAFEASTLPLAVLAGVRMRPRPFDAQSALDDMRQRGRVAMVEAERRLDEQRARFERMELELRHRIACLEGDVPTNATMSRPAVEEARRAARKA